MVTRTAALRLQLIDSVSGPARGVSSSLSGIDRAMARLGKGGSPEIRRLAKELEYLKRKSDAINNFTMSRRGFKELSTDLKAAQSNLARLQQQLKATTNPTAKMKADLDSAKAAVKAATEAFKQQGAAVRATEGALKTYGITSRTAISTSQKQIREDIAKTIKEIRNLEKEASKPKPKADPTPRRAPETSPLRDALTTTGGVVTTHQAGRFAGNAVGLAIDFNEASEYQAALGGLSAKDRESMNAQAQKIGGDTRFSNVDVVRAQTSIMQSGIRNVQTIMDMMGPITDYALAMGVSLEEAAETVKGAAQTKRVDLSDPKKISGFVDFLVQMAKGSGMKDEDVRQYMKYGGAPTTGIGLPDEMAAAIAMVLRRSGVRGDEAGVFARSAASKLVAPTNKGRSALAAMGIDFDSFVKMPDALSMKGLETVIKQDFGKTLSADMREKIQEVLDNGTFTNEDGEEMPIASDRGQFVAAISEIINPLFANDKGKVSAKDAGAIADSLGTFQKNSAESVDVVGLFKAIFSKNPSQAQLNAIFTDKQGGRAKNIASRYDEFMADVNSMKNVKPGLANDIGTKANQGLYGDWTKLTGTVETAMTKIGQDWEFALRPMMNIANEVVDGFNELSPTTRRLIEAFGAAAAVFAGFAATKAAGNILRGVLGGASAGTVTGGTTAVAATSASALTRFLPWLAKAGLPLTAASTVYNALTDIPTAGYQSAQKNNPNMLQDLERMRRIRSEYKGGFEGGRHAAYAGVAPLPNGGKYAGDINEAKRAGEQIEQSLNVTARPEVDTSSLSRALALARSVGSAIRSIGGVTSSSSTPANSNKFGGPRAKGGPVKKGQTYLTGEKGIELFTPGADGHITPNHQLAAAAPSGGSTIHAPITIHIGGKATKEDGAEVVRALDRHLNRTRETSFGGLKFRGDT
jgi:hypothetical protein